MSKKIMLTFALSTVFCFATAALMESTAWARAGGGRSMGSRGSKSFSAPQTPAGPSQASPGIGTPGRNAQTPGAAQPSGGFFSRSPFLTGLAGGLAGGMIGSLLFGGSGHAANGAASGGGIGFLEIALFGLLLYFTYRFFKRRRMQVAEGPSYYAQGAATREGIDPRADGMGYLARHELSREPAPSGFSELQRGIGHITQYDPGFNEDGFKETAQDLFFRIQAGWTNRSLDGIEGILTHEMAEHFRKEFDGMKAQGVVNHLENIAIRKVELSEAWQESGKDFITVLFTANLLDYTVDTSSREVVGGDKLNPVKFQEFWTFCRDVGSPRWQLSAIHQVEH